MEALESFIGAIAGFLWNWPTLMVIIGGGIFFTIYSRFLPFSYAKHAIDLLRGKYSDRNDPGDLSHFQTLCSALSGTIGMGNIGGVAVAVATGGPGALFWMWVCALLGMSTKFFTCTLSVMYRGKDDAGDVQGGPMYYIEEGLGKKWKPVAVIFALCGLIGCLPAFQANQLTLLVDELVYQPNGWFSEGGMLGKFAVGITMAILVGLVIVGGITRIGKVASALVPLMVLLYLGGGLYILLSNVSAIPETFAVIFRDAFSGAAVGGGIIGTIVTGVRRGAFSNEAGLGTEALAHGAARTKEPIREGLVAMLGPFIDTILVCTLTGLIIVNSGLWSDPSFEGVLLTNQVFAENIHYGAYLLLFCVLIFSFTSMIGYSYYVTKCGAYLFGTRSRMYFVAFYLVSIVVASIVDMGLVLGLLDGALALMAIPTTGVAIVLAPKVWAEAKRYFAKLED